jgi:hypothetical protein
MTRRLCDVVLGVALIVGCGVLDAGTVRGQAVHGCFERIFPAKFLRRHGGQSVQRLQLHTLRTVESGGKPVARLKMWFQGDAAAWAAEGLCKNDLNAMTCVLDDDGGAIAIGQEVSGVRLKAAGGLTLAAAGGRGRADKVTIEDPILKSVLLQPVLPAQCK